MNIAFICGFAWEPKGTARARAFPLAVELVRAGHEVTIVLSPYDNRAYSGEDIVSQGVRIINVHVPDSRILMATAIPARLLQTLDSLKPDLVHIFKPKGFAGIVAMLLLECGFRNVVIDCDDWEGWGGWNEVNGYPWIMKEAIDLQERWLIRTAPVLTVASTALFARALKFGRARSRTYYMPNRISRDQAELADLYLTSSMPRSRAALGLGDAAVIFYASHYDPADDVDFLCRAVLPAASRFRATLALVGDGPELPRVLQFFAAHPHVSVRHFGRLSYEQYAAVLAASDVATFPYPDNTVYRAKCSARIIDYMVFGKPILTTAIGQNLDYLVDGKSALLVPPGDEEAYDRALSRLLSDPELRRRLGCNARKRVLADFVWSGDSLASCLAAYAAALNPRAAAQERTTIRNPRTHA